MSGYRKAANFLHLCLQVNNFVNKTRNKMEPALKQREFHCEKKCYC